MRALGSPSAGRGGLQAVPAQGGACKSLSLTPGTVAPTAEAPTRPRRVRARVLTDRHANLGAHLAPRRPGTPQDSTGHTKCRARASSW